MAPRKSRRQLTAGINVCLSPGATQACSLLQTTNQPPFHRSRKKRAPPLPLQPAKPVSAHKHAASRPWVYMAVCLFGGWTLGVHVFLHGESISAHIRHRRSSMDMLSKLQWKSACKYSAPLLWNYTTFLSTQSKKEWFKCWMMKVSELVILWIISSRFIFVRMKVVCRTLCLNWHGIWLDVTGFSQAVSLSLFYQKVWETQQRGFLLIHVCHKCKVNVAGDAAAGASVAQTRDVEFLQLF